MLSAVQGFLTQHLTHGSEHPPPVPKAGTEPWAHPGDLFCVSCPKRVAASPSPTWDLRTPLPYLGSLQALDMRNSLVWQIPKAGEAIPGCAGQILLCSCLSCATQSCLLGAGSAGEGSNLVQWGTPASGCWRWAPSHRCRDIVLQPRGIQSTVAFWKKNEASPESQRGDLGIATHPI